MALNRRQPSALGCAPATTFGGAAAATTAPGAGQGSRNLRSFNSKGVCGGFQELAALFISPYDTDPWTSGAVLGSPILGNSPVETMWGSKCKGLLGLI